MPSGAAAACVVAVSALAGTASPVSAQDRDTIPGVALGLLYESAYQPVLAVAPFSGAAGGESAATQAEAIIRRDLLYSDRFRMADSLPPALLFGTEADLRLWDRLGVDYLLRGGLERSGDGFVLLLELFDVVYGRAMTELRLPVPQAADAGFRMAVHRASDAVVEHVFQEPGMAATRIAFSMRAPGSATKDLYLIDSDGENLRRVARSEIAVLSPKWHPGGQRVAYMALGLDGDAALHELNLVNGQSRRLPSAGDGQHTGAAYLPGGDRLAVTLDLGSRTRIVSFDVARGCCATPLLAGGAQDLSPSFSPDGRWMAFTSNRLGVATPLVYVQRMGAGDGDAELIAPYMFGQSADFTAPDWSPRGGHIAYHGRVGRGRYQILVTDFEARAGRTRQLTWEGTNESPTWAPDGRHLAFSGQRPEGSGLFVVDSVTGRVRLLVSGSQVSTPAWSPPLEQG